MRSSLLITPTLLTFQNEIIDNLKRIANIFNNYFSTIGEKTQAKMKYSHENYSDHLTNENPNAFFLSPRGKEEIKLILSLLDKIKQLVHIVSQVKIASVKCSHLQLAPLE